MHAWRFSWLVLTKTDSTAEFYQLTIIYRIRAFYVLIFRFFYCFYLVLLYIPTLGDYLRIISMLCSFTKYCHYYIIIVVHLRLCDVLLCTIYCHYIINCCFILASSSHVFTIVPYIFHCYVIITETLKKKRSYMLKA